MFSSSVSKICGTFEGRLYLTRDLMQDKLIPKKLKLSKHKPACKPQAKASSKAYSSGEDAWCITTRRASKPSICRLLVLRCL